MRYPEKRQILAGTIILLLLFTINISSAASDAIFTDIDSNYELVPDEGIVKVSKEITFHNKNPDTKYWRGYYSNYNSYLPDGALNIKVFDEENSMAFSKSEEGYYVFYFNNKVWYEDSYTFHVNYEIEVNENTAVFSLNEYGDNVKVTLEVPEEFETHLSRDDYRVEEKLYSSIYIFEEGQSWDEVCTVNSVRASPRLTLKDTAHLTERDVDIEVRYWEGEEQWAQDIMETTIESLELLEEKWGFAYPPEYNITITQANLTETGGYGGYNQGKNGIWLLYTSNHGILVHELSHYWTRACNFDQLWMDEGYADLYTYIILSELEPKDAESRRDRFLKKYEDLYDEYDFPLSDWSTPETLNSNTEERVDYGYKKAFSLTYTLYETIGVEALQQANKEFIENSDGIDNTDFLEIIESVSSTDTEFVEAYLYN
ncbi:M1 family aminopeptidase [Methanolobus vulcani]|uniref:M1 family metallopeptidase n=1 Tax=Methanolobus vulcani TaxID=38026 RepID=A0A7Z8P5J5_9EURY|nr:M1 family aminopeptidase [Methanolobus vulcani]TQD29195.1 M1 family metallopeptidase [Methanolobus vulcani]